VDSQWSEFTKAARFEQTEHIPAGFIATGSKLPRFVGINTLDFYTFPDEFFIAHFLLLDRFPDAIWLPGFWVEYGIAADTSDCGAKVRHHPDKLPTISRFPLQRSIWL
jgi:uroporphyrinogen decarboxylase